jgi:hypothetical protein
MAEQDEEIAGLDDEEVKQVTLVASDNTTEFKVDSGFAKMSKLVCNIIEGDSEVLDNINN